MIPSHLHLHKDTFLPLVTQIRVMQNLIFVKMEKSRHQLMHLFALVVKGRQ